MKLISIHPQKMLAVAANSPRYRLQTALNSQGMNDIPVDHPALPDDIRKTLKWATWEYLLVRNASPNTILFLIIMIGMGLYHQTLIWLLVGVCSVIALILALVGKLIDRPQWASQQLQSFLDTPFLFLVQETLYENLPQLRRLDADIQRLTRTKQEARHIQQQMALLTRQLKEKLILLGESTTDQQVVDLEVAQITQEKIISQAEQLLVE